MRRWEYANPLDDPTREAQGWVSAARTEWDTDDFHSYSPYPPASEPAAIPPSGRTAYEPAEPHNRSAGSAELCRCGCGAKPKAGRFLRGHNRRHVGPKWVEEDHGYDTPCWQWQLASSSKGYGQASVNGRRMSAQRAVYEAKRGPVPTGLELDHLCRNRACVNPDHLEPVTHTENVRRSAATRLTADAVRAIRASSEPARILADRYGVARATITQARSGERWGSLDDSGRADWYSDAA